MFVEVILRMGSISFGTSCKAENHFCQIKRKRHWQNAKRHKCLSIKEGSCALARSPVDKSLELENLKEMKHGVYKSITQNTLLVPKSTVQAPLSADGELNR